LYHLGFIFARNWEANVAYQDVLAVTSQTSRNTDKIGTMDADEVAPKKIRPCGNGTLVAVATTFCGINPSLCITTLHIKNFLTLELYWLAFAGIPSCMEGPSVDS